MEGVPGIWPNHQRGVGTAHLYQAPQVFAPDLLTGVVDVVAVADHRHGHIGELLDDVLEGVFLVVLSPRCDSAAGTKEKNCWMRKTAGCKCAKGLS